MLTYSLFSYKMKSRTPTIKIPDLQTHCKALFTEVVFKKLFTEVASQLSGNLHAFICTQFSEL